MHPILEGLKGRLIVSCQAPPFSPLSRPDIIAALAETAEQNGAGAVRIDSPENIAAAKARVKIPVLGIYKVVDDGCDVYITPTLHAARQVIRAGADILALDATARKRPNGETLEQIVSEICYVFGHPPVMADIATFDEGTRAAELAGVSLLSTTLSGYTQDTQFLNGPDLELVERLSKSVSIPVICEGRLRDPDDVRRAFDMGAYAVVVGGAITGIDELVRKFRAATPIP